MNGRKLFRFRAILPLLAVVALSKLLFQKRRIFYRILTAKTLPAFPVIAIITGLTVIAALLVRRRPAFVLDVADKKPFLVRAIVLLCGLAVFATLLFLRRPSEVLHPYIWAEDGTRNIPDYLRMGFTSLLLPVNGYLIVIPKLINVVSLKFTFLYYPEVSMIAGFLFNLFVLAAIWKAPTVLPGKFFCALAALLIPNGSEVYILPLYTLWWAGLLISLALLWDPESKTRTALLTRIGFLTAGGLSSPIIVLSAPIFILRAFIQRTRREWGIALIAVVVAAVQLLAIRSNISGGTILQNLQETGARGGGLQTIILKYFSWGFFYPFQIPLWAIAPLIIAVGFSVRALQSKPNPFFYLIAPMYAVAVTSSLSRVSPWIVDPVRAGPRYFFYPYVFTWWFVTGLAVLLTKEYWGAAVKTSAPPKAPASIRDHLAPSTTVAQTSPWCKTCLLSRTVKFIGMIICYTLLGAGIVFSSRQYTRNSQSNLLHWRALIIGSINSEKPAIIPIQYNGRLNAVWYLKLQPDQCKALINGSFLDHMIVGENSPP